MTMNTYEQGGEHFFKWIPGVQTAYGVSDRNMFSVDSEPYLNFTPIGTFISRLLKKLAITDKRLKDFSWYFGQAVGGGASLKWRNWGENILTKEARHDLIINSVKYQKNNFMGDA